MKKPRYTDSQIVAILKQNESGISVSDLCREHGMSSNSFYQWRSPLGSMDASMKTRMKELETEYRRFGKVYAQEKLQTEIAPEAV